MKQGIDLNTSPALPVSGESIESASGGALGGLSKADLVRGFENLSDKLGDGQDGESLFLSSNGPGFLTRPQGWER